MDPDSVYREQPETNTFFFYDLETSGLSPKNDRIMQFAGQRTTLNFEPIGEPVNLLVKMSDDTLPSPAAIVVTGILPQSTVIDGLSEAEFCQYIQNEIFTPNTIAVGYNSVRFDDEFMRYTFWRNFHDPYEWQWKDGRSRWDLLDVVRLTRALRPEGINWPVTDENRPTNRLELLTKLNGIEHTHAHDALSDVEALISVTKLIAEKQPKLYNYLFKMRNKNLVKSLVNLKSPTPFVYASGRYSSENMHTTVAVPIAAGQNDNIMVFDLRYNLEDLLKAEKDFTPETRTSEDGTSYETCWRWSPYVKELAPNRCPAVSPVGVLDATSTEDSTDSANPHKKGTSGWEKLGLSPEIIEKNLKILNSHPEFVERMIKESKEKVKKFEKINKNPAESDDFIAKFAPHDAEGMLYDGFLSDFDRGKCVRLSHITSAEELSSFTPNFKDKRLKEIYPRFLARNFRSALSREDALNWEKYRTERLKYQEKDFVAQITNLKIRLLKGEPAHDGRPIDEDIIEDLLLWYQSLAASDNDFEPEDDDFYDF